METVLSGIRSTGKLHLGNYWGAVRNFVQLQDSYDCYFFIADYHSLTTHPRPEDLHGNVKQVLAEYLAAGLDPDKACLYIQSGVPEISELYLLMNMNAYLGELERTASFKEKARKQPDNVNAGLLTYPVLMAVDILIHHADWVPVGKDQEQNLEMARKFAKRFNRIYNTDLFTIPSAFKSGMPMIKVPGLDGSGKMGKSEGNGIFLSDSTKQIHKKVMRAKTDAGPEKENQEKPEAVANLFKLMELASSKDTYRFFDEQYNSCNIRYGDMKKQLAKDIDAIVAPIRERINEILADDSLLRNVAKQGADKARENAQNTIKEVRNIIGFRPF